MNQPRFKHSDDVGRYRIQHSLGEGGMGSVYLATDTETGSEVALKFLLKDEPEGRARLEREAKLAALIWHRNVVRVYRLDYLGEEPFIVSEFIEGSNLTKISSSELDQALVILRQIASGLAAAHAAGIVHRDITPANILLRNDGSPVIVDFGLGKRATLTQSERTEIELTDADTIHGTPCYMSPERLKQQELTSASDIFSFGLVAFEFLTARNLFRRVNLIETLIAVVKDAIPRLIEERPDLPPHIAAVIDRCLLRTPAGRPTAAEIALRLETLAETVSRTRSADIVSGPRWLKTPREGVSALGKTIASHSVLVEHAIDAVRHRPPDCELSITTAVGGIVQSLIESAPDPAGNSDALLQALDATVDSVCDAARLARAIAATPHHLSVRAQYKGLARLLREYDDKSGDTNLHHRVDLGYYRFLGHELVLIQVAALIREKRWAEIGDILGLGLVPWTDDPAKVVAFDRFSDHVESLELLARQRNRVSPHADLLFHRHSDEPLSALIAFKELIAADFLLFLRSEFAAATESSWRPWRPWSTLYLREAPAFVLEAELDGSVVALGTALGLTNVEGLRDRMLEHAARLPLFWKIGVLGIPLRTDELGEIIGQTRTMKA
ncbi:MAG TPA: serine/threonine-protein kinase [Thermoanaerobaculia bacterium]|nr:serine/threonine-protein kinase [Thermoanaerobaculia bacterium]